MNSKGGRKAKELPSNLDRNNLIDLGFNSVRAYARHFGVGEALMKKRLNDFDIRFSDSRVVNNDKARPMKEELSTVYESRSLRETEQYFGIGKRRLRRWLEHYNITIKGWGKTSAEKNSIRHQAIKPTREVLSAEYEILIIHELATKYGVDKSVIRGWLTDYDIPIRQHTSRAEDLLYAYCVSLDDSFERNNRTIIAPLELDIVSPKLKIAIEFCGLYWHSAKVKTNRKYHQDKLKMANDAGYELLTIFESDDMNKVQSLIRSKLAIKSNRIFARKTVINPITSKEAKAFHDAHHLSNGIYSSVNYGVFYEGTLVMVASFSKSRYDTKHDWECTRMTSHSDWSVVGGVSKLFARFFKDHSVKSCVTYADLRFGTGASYLNCGFVKTGSTQPNYFYFKNSLGLESRVKYQKHKLAKIFPDHYSMELTEEEIMNAAGYNRIYDCGSHVYSYMYK
jgi:hypothetical protein